jgi:electron transfer flavoprotein beta subunit
VKIAVCLKPVPATDTRVKLDAAGRRLDPAGVSMVINPYDEFALEEALKLREAAGAGEVVLVTVGPASFGPTIRNGLAMGADSAVLLQADGEVDPLQVARALAHELEGKGYELILCGKQAVDDDASQVAPMLAELLSLPCATVVAQLTLEGPVAAGTKAQAHREIEGGIEEVAFALPAVVAAQKGLNEPRYPSLKGIMAAKKKTIEERPAQLGEPALEVLALTLPAARSAGRILGEGVSAVPELVRVLREEAKVI